MLTVELNVIEVSLIKLGLVIIRLTMRLMMRLIMRLERKVEICLSLKKQNWAFSHPELEWPLPN